MHQYGLKWKNYNNNAEKRDKIITHWIYLKHS